MEIKHKIKATDYLIESLKLMVTISMLFIGGIVAYSGYVDFNLNTKFFYISISLLILSSLSSVFNINSIINKIYGGNEEAIRVTEVRVINAVSIISLLLGISFGIYSILDSDRHLNDMSISSNKSTVISDSKIIIGSAELPSIKIDKTEEGKIKSIEINKGKNR